MCASQLSAQTSLLPTLQALRPEYPTPMSRVQIGEYLNRVAWLHRDEGWGLMKKPGKCPAPQGVDISCDILIHEPSIHHFDVLIDWENKAIPSWQDDGPCIIGPTSGCSMSYYLAPISPVPPKVTGLRIIR